jgi:hypothetical protein
MNTRETFYGQGRVRAVRTSALLNGPSGSALSTAISPPDGLTGWRACTLCVCGCACVRVSVCVCLCMNVLGECVW